MNLSDFIHPDDKKALDALQAIPLAGTLVKQVMRYFQEQMAYGMNMAQKVRLSDKQIPHLYKLLPPICKELDIKEPEFYLEMNPTPNAYAMGETRTAVTITSGIVTLMTEDELRAVIAHECGHILCHHMLYTTLANTIINVSPNYPDVLQSAVMALLYWNRKSELSCDRVAAFITNPEVATSMLSRLSGGSPEITRDFDIMEYAAQADAYEEIRTEDIWNTTLQAWMTCVNTHPLNAVRVRELLRWTNSEQYINIAADIPLCPECHRAIDPNWAFCKYCGTHLK